MKIKKLLSVLTACLLIAVICSGCNSKWNSGSNWPKHTEDFYYYYFSYNGGDRLVEIGELTEIGKTKEVIVIPRKIDDCPVRRLYYSPGLKGVSVFESDELKKIYIPNADSLDKTFYSCPNLEKVIWYDCEDFYYGNTWKKQEGANTRVYVRSTAYDSEKCKDGHYRYGFGDYKDYMGVYFANVSFMYNFATINNEEYYFIDDIDYGARIEYIPDAPTRKGYTFEGWYREPECINKWNFDTDTLPEEKTEEDEDGETIVIYQETKLYAKWIKK